MTISNQTQYAEKLVTEIVDYLNNIDWQWFCTLTFNEHKFRGYKSNTIQSLVNRFYRDICISEGIQVAGFYVISYRDGHPHVHALLFGKNKFGKSLSDVEPSKWERAWPSIAKIEVPISRESVCRYFAKHFYGANNRNCLEFYNIKLLKNLLNKPKKRQVQLQLFSD